MLKPTIKRLIAVLLAIFMLILCTTGAYAAETPTEDEQPTHSPIYFGDITDDADNKPTIKDATLIQQYVADIKTLQNIRTYAFTKDGTLMTQEELINYLCDVNKDGEVSVLDATDIQRYLAGLDVKDTNLGKIAFEWRDAEYRNVYPNKEIEVVDEEAYDETVETPVHQTGVETRCVYKKAYKTTICNDCDMPLIYDDGTALSDTDLWNHIDAHKVGLLPVTAHKLRLTWLDPTRKMWEIREENTENHPLKISYTDPETDENVAYNLTYDEAEAQLNTAYTYGDALRAVKNGKKVPWFIFEDNHGAYGSYRNNYPSELRPTGEMETIPLNDYVPEYRSGYAWVCRRCGKVAYFEDGKEYDQRDRDRHTRGTVNHVMENYQNPDFVAQYTCAENPQTCPELLENGKYPVQNFNPSVLGGFDWVWTDKIPTGRFTDVPKATTTTTVHHDAVTHTEMTDEIDYDAEPIRKELIKEAGFYAVY